MTAWVWPDVTAVVVGALVDVVSCPVGTRVPSGAAVEFVRVQRVGGPRGQVLDRARVVVECWSTSEDSAWDLAATVRDAMRVLPPAGGTTSVAEVGGPALVADPLTGTPRYWLTFEVVAKPTAEPA